MISLTEPCAQNALRRYVPPRVDLRPRRMGQWLFTGSQEAPLMRGITESMAGRAPILQLLPFSLAAAIVGQAVGSASRGSPKVSIRVDDRGCDCLTSFLSAFHNRGLSVAPALFPLARPP